MGGEFLEAGESVVVEHVESQGKEAVDKRGEEGFSAFFALVAEEADGAEVGGGGGAGSAADGDGPVFDGEVAATGAQGRLQNGIDDAQGGGESAAAGAFGGEGAGEAAVGMEIIGR